MTKRFSQLEGYALNCLLAQKEHAEQMVAFQRGSDVLTISLQYGDVFTIQGDELVRHPKTGVFQLDGYPFEPNLEKNARVA